MMLVPFKTRAFSAILFVTVAIPGMFVFLVGSFTLIISLFFTPLSSKRLNPFLSLLAILIGSTMLLFGLRKSREWLYLFVFWSMPLSLLVFSLLGMFGLLVAFATPF